MWRPSNIDCVEFDGNEIDAELWKISENLHRAKLSDVQRSEQIARWVELVDQKVSAQLEPKLQGGRPEGGINRAARELGVRSGSAQRAVKVRCWPIVTLAMRRQPSHCSAVMAVGTYCAGCCSKFIINQPKAISMHRRTFLITSGVFAFMGTSSLAQTANAQEFVQLAGSSGLFEIESSKLAQQRASREDVKSFAEMMIKDHTAAAEKLKAVATKEGFQVPAVMTDKHAAMYKDLEDTEGADFEAAYVKAQVDGHMEAVDLFTQYSANGDNGPLKSFAQETLPTLKTHLEQIQTISGKA